MAVSSKSQSSWTTDEIRLLSDKYPVMKASAIKELLPRHTIHGIYAKACQIGLRAYRTTDDFKLLFAMGHTNHEIADLMGCSLQAVSYHHAKLNNLAL